MEEWTYLGIKKNYNSNKRKYFTYLGDSNHIDIEILCFVINTEKKNYEVYSVEIATDEYPNLTVNLYDRNNLIVENSLDINMKDESENKDSFICDLRRNCLDCDGIIKVIKESY